MEKIIVHSQYASKYIRETRSYTEIFDIALLKLDVAVNLFHFTPACLPGRNLNVAGKTAWVYGWGMHEEGRDKPISNILRETTVKVISAQECTQKQHWEHAGILPSHLCAWTVGQDSCRGDSGGPLTFEQDGKHTLIGVVSFGEEICGKVKISSKTRRQHWFIVCFRPSRQAFTVMCPNSEIG